MKYIVFLLFFISINAFAGVEDDEMAVTNYIRCELIFNKKSNAPFIYHRDLANLAHYKIELNNRIFGNYSNQDAKNIWALSLAKAAVGDKEISNNDMFKIINLCRKIIE